MAQGQGRPRIKWWTLKGDVCKKLRNRILGGQLVREIWEIFEAKDKISVI